MPTKTTDPKLVSVINDVFALENAEKFNRGQREHGGDFAVKPTVRQIREEAIDLVNYTHILAKHRSGILVELSRIQDRVKLMGAKIDQRELQADLTLITKLVHDL